MAFFIFADDTRPYDGRDLETRPLGGTESSVIRLSRALAGRGHKVTVYTPCNAPVEHEGVRYESLSGNRPETCDVYVAVHHPRLFGLVRRPKRRVVWVTWPANQLRHYKKLPLVWWYRPIPVLMSLHQAQMYSRLLPRRNPHIVIPLGLPDDIRGLPPLPEPPGPEVIFASNPVRNLAGLIRIWAERILPKRPDAVMNVYGIHAIGAEQNAWQTWPDTILPRDISEAARASIRIHPTQSRAALMAAVRRSRAMLYLGHKAEAFCLSLAEAQAMGVPCVIAPVAVLPERVIDGVTGFVRADAQEFADSALSLLNDDALWRSQHEAALKTQQGLSWAEAAARFESAILSDRIDTNRSWSA